MGSFGNFCFLPDRSPEEGPYYDLARLGTTEGVSDDLRQPDVLPLPFSFGASSLLSLLLYHGSQLRVDKIPPGKNGHISLRRRPN